MKVTIDTRICPECEVDWRADQIPVEYVVKDYYGHEPPCKRKFKYPEPDTEPCTCVPRYYSNLVGIELPYNDPNHYDGVSYWQCPACCARWDRFTGVLVSTSGVGDAR